MADATKTIDLVFNGVDKTGAATEAALKNTKKFAQGVESATQPVADFTASALKFETALIAAGVAATAFSVKIAGEFDTAFREISTLIGSPIEDLGTFRDSILSYAETSVKPLEEVTQSIYNAISAGVEFSESIEAVAQAEKLSVAGKASLNESLTVLVSSLNAYGFGMDKAQQFSDALFTTVEKGQTTLPELAGALSSVTGLAATAGVSFEELLAAVAALTSTGTSTSQAVTQIQGAISAILKPSEQAASLAKELGIGFNLQTLEAKGLSGILAEVQLKTGGNAEQMAKLFGRVEALNGVLTLTGLGADKFAENLQSMEDSAGAVDAAFEKMSGSFELHVQKVQNGLRGLFIAIGDPLLDEFGGVAEAIRSIFIAVGDSVDDGNISELVAYIESQFGGLQDSLEEVAKNIPDALNSADLSGFINGLEAVKGAIGGLFGGIDITTVDGLADAITGVGQAFNGLSQFSAGVIESFKPLVSAFFDVGEGLGEIDEEAFRSAGEIAGFITQLNLLSGPMVTVAASLIALKEAMAIGGSVKALTAALGSGAGGGLIGSLKSLGAVGGGAGIGFGIGTIANELTELTTGTSISTWATDLAISWGLLDDEATNIVDSLNDIPPAMEAISNTTAETADSSYNFADALESAEKKLAALGNSGELLPELYGDIDKAAESTENLAQAAQKLELEERLALIDSQTKITTAQIDADAEKMVAAFDSVSVSVDSTGKALISLYGLLGDDNISKLDKLDISNQIEIENERRQEALDLQNKMLAAQIRETNARANLLQSGSPLITVNGDGLQPHLEAFMFEVLEAIQVQVNADGYEMLLGIT